MSVSAPSAPPRFDPERFATPVAAAGAGCVIAGVGAGGPTGLALGAAGVVLLLASATSRRDGLLVLGPFVARELAVTARRPHHHVVRVAILLVTLMYAGLVAHWFLGLDWPEVTSFRPLVTKAGDATTAALVAFFGLALMLYLVAVGAAGFSVPPVVAEEREADRLDHLLVTDLRNREIVLGKAVGRLATLVGFALLPVPVMFLLTLLGGVDVWYVVATITLVAGSLAGVVGIALGCSAGRRRVSSAVAATWVIVLAYFVLTGAAYAGGTALAATLGAANPQAPAGTKALADVAADALVYVGSGNPFVTAYELVLAGVRNVLDVRAGSILRNFAAVNLAVLAAGWWYALRHVRRDSRASPAVAVTRNKSARGGWRSPVTEHPVLWYERMHAAAGRRRRFGPRAGLWAWVVLALIAAWLIGGAPWMVGTVAWTLAHLTGPLTLALVTIPTGWRAARSLARERERGTLDGLRLTDLAPAEIAVQKWWAAVVPGGQVLLFVAALWGVVYVTIAVHWGGRMASEFGYFPAWALGTAAANGLMAASLGQLCSVLSRTQTQAVGRLLRWSAVWGVAVATLFVYYWADGKNPYVTLVALPPAAQGLSGRLLSDPTRYRYHWEQLTTAYAGSVAVALVLAVVLEVVAVALYRRQFSTRAERPAERARRE